MNRILRVVGIILWIIGLFVFARVAYTSQFGAGNLFGTAVFGSGSTTTSTVLPGIQQKHIIGGGIVMLPPQLTIDDPKVMLFDKLILQEDSEWERLQD